MNILLQRYLMLTGVVMNIFLLYLFICFVKSKISEKNNVRISFLFGYLNPCTRYTFISQFYRLESKLFYNEKEIDKSLFRLIMLDLSIIFSILKTGNAEDIFSFKRESREVTYATLKVKKYKAILKYIGRHNGHSN